MNLVEFLCFILVIVAGMTVRHFLPLFWNKLVLCLTLFIGLYAISNISGVGDLRILLYVLFVLLVSYSFQWFGAVGSLIVVLLIDSNSYDVKWFFLMLLFSALAGILIDMMRRRRLLSDTVWLRQMYKQSRYLSILKEVGIAFQSTMEVSKLLHIILTAITAGYGLGFNRALLFLVDEQDAILKGELGIGAMSQGEGLVTWNRVVSRRMNLVDFIDKREESQFRDNKLIALLRQIEIPIHAGDHIFKVAMENERPYIISKIDQTDLVQRLLAETFQMSSFAVIPMLNQGKGIGVIVVDNNVNHLPIDFDDIDNIIPLAAQASVAIENSHLYERTQQMSITDGLTGLFNQRYYQETLYKLVDEAEDKGLPLSLIITDIDYFKNYNDTNGHLEGNHALIALSGIIKQVISDQDVPCRFGGEEFAVFIPHTSASEALHVAEKLRSSVEKYAFHNEAAQPSGKLTISLGIASYEVGMGAINLQDMADKALYEAKRKGRNRVILHEDGVKQW